MISDDSFIKLQAQVQGLESVLKTLIALHLSSRVKDEAGFAKAAEEAAAVKKVALEHLETLRNHPGVGQIMPDVTDLVLGEMRATIARCWEEPELQMRRVAEAILSVSQPPTDARN